MEPPDIGQLSIGAAHLQIQALNIVKSDCLQPTLLRRIAALGKHANSLVPISKLPIELVLDIISPDIDDYDLPFIYDQVQNSRRYLLSTVCWRWYLAIRDHAPFWTKIRSWDPSYTTSISRSRDALIHLEYVKGSGKQARTFFERLDVARARWLTAVVDLPEVQEDESDYSAERHQESLSDEEICLSLFGEKLASLDLTSRRRSGPFRAPLALQRCLALQELHTYNISFALPPDIKEPLPSLTHLSMYGFSETSWQWRTIMSLIAASGTLEELSVTPRDVAVFSPLQHSLAEVDEWDVPQLPLPKLRSLTITRMPPNTLNLFLRRIELDPGKVSTLHLLICDPIDETLDVLSNPASFSVAAAIKALFTALTEAMISATFEQPRERIMIQASDSETTGLYIYVEAHGAISRMLRLPPALCSHDAPRLHIRLESFQAAPIPAQLLIEFLRATPTTVACEMGYGAPFADLMALLQEPEAPVQWHWPKLASLGLPKDSIDPMLQSGWQATVAARAAAFEAHGLPVELKLALTDG